MNRIDQKRIYGQYQDVDTPDISWFLIENKQEAKTVYQYYLDENLRLKSKGSVQTLLHMHTLMHRSLDMVSPHLVFSPDFPDYLLDIDDPKYTQQGTTTVTYNNGIPQYASIDSELNKSEWANMPHHRPDLYTDTLYNAIYNDTDEPKTLETIPRPTITWGTVRTEPGTVGGPAFEGTQELKPRPREYIAVFNPDVKKYIGFLPGETVEQYGRLVKYIQANAQVFDHLVQYNIWARTAWEVEELTEWFKEYMRQYTGMFREAGIVNMHFDRRVRDDTLTQRKNKFHVRSILYYIRTESVNLDTILPIRRVDANIHVENLPTLISRLDPDEMIVDNVHDKIVEKWFARNTIWEPELNN